MANAVTLKTIGDWKSQIGLPLRDVLAVSIDVFGRTGEEACKHALILMAQSARKLAPQSKKNRKVERDTTISGKNEFVTVYNQRRAPNRLYRLQFGDQTSAAAKGDWNNAKRIGNSGLAKRAWMWGLGKLGASNTGAAIRGASKVYTLKGANNTAGYIKENRLDYILKAMPAGWERSVEIAAGNKIMARARDKVQRQWQARVKRRERATARTIQSFFKAAA